MSYLSREQRADNLVQVAMSDRLLQQMEVIYRQPDIEDGPACLAVVILQGAERIGSDCTMDEIEQAVIRRWEQLP